MAVDTIKDTSYAFFLWDSEVHCLYIDGCENAGAGEGLRLNYSDNICTTGDYVWARGEVGLQDSVYKGRYEFSRSTDARHYRSQFVR